MSLKGNKGNNSDMMADCVVITKPLYSLIWAMTQGHQEPALIVRHSALGRESSESLSGTKHSGNHTDWRDWGIDIAVSGKQPQS